MYAGGGDKAALNFDCLGSLQFQNYHRIATTFYAGCLPHGLLQTNRHDADLK
jgi:hypothetical protein